MKKIALLFSGLMMAGLMFTTSCSTDSTTPGDIHPAMNFVGGAGYTSGDASLTVGQIFKVGINAFSSTESNAKLAKFTVTRIFDNKPFLVLDSNLNVTQFSIDINIDANLMAGTENFVFTITDKDNQSKELSFVITTVEGAGAINTFSMKILGAQSNTLGSSFASVNGNVYKIAEARNNAAIIDWLYFYGNVNNATIASPDDADASNVFNGPDGLSFWAVRNPTRFKRIMDPVDWDAITNDATIVALTASGVTETKINNLDITDIMAFITASGKKGLIRVEEIQGTSAGTMTISVKVQQ